MEQQASLKLRSKVSCPVTKSRALFVLAWLKKAHFCSKLLVGVCVKLDKFILMRIPLNILQLCREIYNHFEIFDHVVTSQITIKKT